MMFMGRYLEANEMPTRAGAATGSPRSEHVGGGCAVLSRNGRACRYVSDASLPKSPATVLPVLGFARQTRVLTARWSRCAKPAVI